MRATGSRLLSRSPDPRGFVRRIHGHVHSRRCTGKRSCINGARWRSCSGSSGWSGRWARSTILAAAPDVREITPADIAIDGSAVDWDEPAADFLSDMYEAGKPDKDVLSKLYGRYDCSTETFYVLVQTVPGWNILPSDNDNYVKLGQTDKLVDGSSGHNGAPPDFAYIGARPGRLRSISPPAATSATTASMCTPRWSRTPAPRPQRWRTVAWTSPSTAARRRPRPRRPPHLTPTPDTDSTRRHRHPNADIECRRPTPDTDAHPHADTHAHADSDFDPDPDAPVGSIEPSAEPTPVPPIDPPIIVPKVNDQGTPETSDDRIVPGAVFEFRRDDGDGTYEPVGDDSPVLAQVDATNGFAVLHAARTGRLLGDRVDAPTRLGGRRPDPRALHRVAGELRSLE